MFYSFGFWGGPANQLPNKSQINYTWRFILSYERLALAWFFSCPALLILNYPNYISPLGFYLSLFLRTLLYFLLHGWLAGCVAGWLAP